MKIKLAAILAFLALAASAQAGLRVAVFAGGAAGWCTRPCAPAFSRSCQFWPACIGPVYYSWWPVGYSWGVEPGFSTISPVMAYSPAVPVYKVPPPVLPVQPVAVYPDTTFQWKR